MKKATMLKIIGVLLGFSLIGSIAGVVAWFNPIANISVEDNPIEGTTEGAYFAYGDGTTKAKAYGITKPRHLYNLAWLTYLGYFKDKQCYFKLGNDVSMSDWTIPPIGTSEFPFVGNFNGNGHIVSNCTISNKFTDFGSKHPGAVTSTNFKPNSIKIVGFFGIIGEYPNDLYTGAYSSAVNTVYDLGLENVIVDTYSADTLIGMAAGYVDADISNVAVASGSINVKTGAGTTVISPASNISEHSIVGYTTKKKDIRKVNETIYSVNTPQTKEFNANDQGIESGWGGSIDMKSVMERLLTIRNSITPSTSFPYKRTYNYYDGEKDSEYNIDAYGTGSRTYLKSNNEEMGHFNIISDDDNSQNKYALLGGGHWETHSFYESKGYKITNGTEYLSVSSYTESDGANRGTLFSTTDPDSAVVWNIPSGNSGFISTIYSDYYYDASTYYLYNNNGALQLSRGDGYRTTWYKDVDANGKIRFKTSQDYSGYYLDFNNSSWKLTRFEQPPEAPEKPGNGPTYPEKDPYPEEPAQISKEGYALNNYQIYAIVDGTKRYLNYSGGTLSVSTSLSAEGWVISNISGSTTTIKAGSTDNYLRADRSGSQWSGGYTYTASLGGALDWRKSGSGPYQLSYKWGSRTRYFTISNSSYSMSNNQAYIYIVQTETEIDSINAAHDQWIEDCEAIDNAFEAAVIQYNEDKEEYDEEVEAYGVAMETYNTETYPNYVSRVNQVGYVIEQTEGISYGNQTYYLSSTLGGMNYEENDVTYFPLNTVNNTTDFRPADNNTAYIVAGSSIKADTETYNDLLTNVRFSNYYAISGNISNDYNATTDKFTHIYTVNYNNGTFTRDEITATEEENDYEKLTAAKTGLANALKDSSQTYGVHFMQAPISMGALTTAKYVKVNNEDPYENYQLPVNSIDFHLKEFGYVNFIAGSYFTGNSSEGANNSFFSLYQIERLDSNPKLINRILEIKKVYSHSSGEKKYSYVYELEDTKTGDTFYTKPYVLIDALGNKKWLYDDETNYSKNQYVDFLPASYKMKFDVARIKKNNIAEDTFLKHVYYFEIPMNDGEFCLGSVNGGTGCYLMYLDIAANAAKTQRTIISEHYKLTEEKYAYPVGVAFITYSSSGIDDTNSASMTIPTGFAGKTLSVTRSGDTLTVKEGNTVTLTGDLTYLGDSIIIADTIKEKLKPKETSTKEVKRLQYYDFNVNLEQVTKTIIADTYLNGSTTPTRTVEQYTLNSDNTWAEVSESNWKIYRSSDGNSYNIADVKSPTSLALNGTTASGGLGWVDPGSTVLLTIYYTMAEGVNASETLTLNLVIDENNTNGQYYLFNDYAFAITSTGGTINIKVLAKGTGTIKINDTTVTKVGQEITVPAGS